MKPYWEFVWAGYVLTWTTLLAYAASIEARRRREAAAAGGDHAPGQGAAAQGGTRG